MTSRTLPSASTAHPDSAELGSTEPRLLASMPLHAITVMHGEAGLRKRLAIEIAAFPPRDRAQIEQALALASRLHAGDRRQREPYVNHLLRVTTRILSHYRVRDPDLACAALLHDAAEDHAARLAPRGSQPDAITALAAQFGNRVASLVAAVTNPPRERGQDRHEQYRHHVIASLDASPWARILKASDFTDNAAGLIYTTGPRASRLAAKYAPLAPVLRDLILRPDTPLDPEVKTLIARQFTDAQQRLTALMSGDARQRMQDHEGRTC